MFPSAPAGLRRPLALIADNQVAPAVTFLRERLAGAVGIVRVSARKGGVNEREGEESLVTPRRRAASIKPDREKSQ